MHQKQTFLLLSGQTCLISQPALITVLGRTPSQFIQQIHYWTTAHEHIGVFKDGVRWVFNTLDDWSSQIKICKRQLQRIIHRLKEAGVLMVKNLGNQLLKKYAYAINYDKLSSLIIPSIDKKSTSSGHSVHRNTKNTEQREANISRHKVFEKKQEEPQEPFQKSPANVKLPGTVESSEQKSQDLPEVLLKIWNETAGKSIGESQLTKKRARWLVAAFQRKFASSKEDWKNFCQNLTTSPFLMGQIKPSFRVSLDWVLSFDIIQRIMEGDYGVRRAATEQTVPEVNTVIETIKKSTVGPEKNVRIDILRCLGTSVYVAWFLRASCIIQNDTVLLKVGNSFIKEYIETHFLYHLTKQTGKQFLVRVETALAEDKQQKNGMS